jgi:hypothetical protein
MREWGFDEGTFRKIIHAAAAAAIVSGLLNIVYFAAHPSGGEPPAAHAVNGWYAPLHGLEILGQLSFLLAITGMYLAQNRAMGRLGFAGYVLLLVGTIFVIGTLWGDGFFSPVLAGKAPRLLDRGRDLYVGALFWASGAMVATITLGFLMFGAASFRARVFPRTAVAMMTLGGVMVPLPPPPYSKLPWAVFIAGAIILAIGLTGLGLALAKLGSGDSPPDPN